MLILTKCCFLHVPKTGGTWVKKSIKAAGIQCRDYSIAGNPHIGFSACPVPGTFRFAFVRHPVDLYRSYWQFKMTNEWDPRNQIDMDCRSNDFHEFIQNVLDKYPGVYGKRLLQFIGPPENEIEFIGRYENLAADLIEALRSAGEIFDETVIKSFPPYNVSDKKKFQAVYTSALEEQVKITEAAVMQRFNYS